MTRFENGDRFVVDAPIVLKWILPEPYCEAARRIVAPGHTVLAPDVILSQIGLNLSTRVRMGELRDHEADEILRVVGLMPIHLHRTWSLAPEALDIEGRIRCDMPACIHLALAVREEAVYVTSNFELYRAVVDSAFEPYIEWIGNSALLT